MASMYPWLESYGHPDKDIKIDHHASGQKSSVYKRNLHYGTFHGPEAPINARNLAHIIHNDESVRADNSPAV